MTGKGRHGVSDNVAQITHTQPSLLLGGHSFVIECLVLGSSGHRLSWLRHKSDARVSPSRVFPRGRDGRRDAARVMPPSANRSRPLSPHKISWFTTMHVCRREKHQCPVVHGDTPKKLWVLRQHNQPQMPPPPPFSFSSRPPPSHYPLQKGGGRIDQHHTATKQRPTLR